MFLNHLFKFKKQQKCYSLLLVQVMVTPCRFYQQDYWRDGGSYKIISKTLLLNLIYFLFFLQLVDEDDDGDHDYKEINVGFFDDLIWEVECTAKVSRWVILSADLWRCIK